jgi:WD40 repeat protein
LWWLTGLPAVLLLVSSASSASLQATLLLTTMVASGRHDDSAVRVLDSVPAQRLLDRKAQRATWAWSAARVVTALAVSPDNVVIAGGSDDGYLLFWDATTGELRHSLAAHRDRVRAVAFSPDGTKLVSSAEDNITCVWDRASGERIHTLEQKRLVSYLAFEPGTGLLIGATYDGLVYWELSDGAQIQRRTFGNSAILSANISLDGLWLSNPASALSPSFAVTRHCIPSRPIF